MNVTATRALQQALNDLGYGPLQDDGIYGRHTAAAYESYLATRPASDPVPLPPAPPAPVPWWRSRAILGLLATALAGLAQHFGLALTHEQLDPILFQAAELAGLVLAAWGTVRRRAPIDQTLVARLGERTVRLPLRAGTDPAPGADSTAAGPDPAPGAAAPPPGGAPDPRGAFTPD